MEKKKMRFLKIFLIGIGIIFVIFSIYTIRNMIIFSNLQKRVSQYIDNNNHYEKIVEDSGSTATITEYYCKDDKSLLKLETTVKSTEETRKLINYSEGERTNTYIESNGDKIAIPNSNAIPTQLMIMSLDYNNNLWNLFQLSATSFIKNGKCNDKECYVIYGGLIAKETYIEKETGLTIKRIDGMTTDEKGKQSDVIMEYYYEFDNVKDEDLIEPDISEYTVQEYN